MATSRTTLILLATSFLVAGVVEAFLSKTSGPYSAGEVVHIVVIAILTYVWCKQDAQSRGTVPPIGAALLAGVLPPIGVPAYFLRTRKLPQAAIAIGKTLLFLLGAGILLGVGYFLGDLLKELVASRAK
jgi:hypothetical protein